MGHKDDILPVEEIFSFDVSAFKSFEILYDLSPKKGTVEAIILNSWTDTSD